LHDFFHGTVIVYSSQKQEAIFA